MCGQHILNPSDFHYVPSDRIFVFYELLVSQIRFTHAWKDPLIFSELTHYLFIAPYDRIQRRNQSYQFESRYDRWRDLKRPLSNLPFMLYMLYPSDDFRSLLPNTCLAKLHFQVKLCKIQAFDNTQTTKTQPCSKWRRLDWTFSDVINPSQSTFSAEKRFDCVDVSKDGLRGKFHELGQLIKSFRREFGMKKKKTIKLTKKTVSMV